MQNTGLTRAIAVFYQPHPTTIAWQASPDLAVELSNAVCYRALVMTLPLHSGRVLMQLYQEKALLLGSSCQLRSLCSLDGWSRPLKRRKFLRTWLRTEDSAVHSLFRWSRDGKRSAICCLAFSSIWPSIVACIHSHLYTRATFTSKRCYWPHCLCPHLFQSQYFLPIQFAALGALFSSYKTEVKTLFHFAMASIQKSLTGHGQHFSHCQGHKKWRLRS